MSLSRNSSFENINIVVNEKGRDPLQFIANPDSTSDQIDLKGLSESARKSFATLRLWNQVTGCFDHRLVKAIIDNISVEGDKYYIALNKTVANARRGQTLASEVVDLCKALADKHDSPEEPLNALVSKLIKGAEKAHGCSIKTRDELKGVRDALSKISKDIRLGVDLMIEKHTPVSPDLEDDIPFNGVNTCFVTFPKHGALSAKGAVSVQTGGWDNSSGWDPVVNAAPDSDDEDAIIESNQVNSYRNPGWDDPPNTAVKHLSFANAADQLVRIVRDVSSFVEHFERCVDWWARMKAGLDGLKDTFPGVTLERTGRTLDLIRGWNGLADQFEIYIYRTKPFLTNYSTSYLHTAYAPAQPRKGSSRITYIPPPIVPITPPESSPEVPPSQAAKSKPLRKKLPAVAWS